MATANSLSFSSSASCLSRSFFGGEGGDDRREMEGVKIEEEHSLNCLMILLYVSEEEQALLDVE